MGKYDNKFDHSDIRHAEVTVKIMIANELAEANRLKRLELSLNIQDDKFGHSGQGTGYWITDNDKVKKELEDQA